MRKLVWQSKRLQHKMSARDAETWSKVITQEEALDRHAQRALRITPIEEEDDEGPDDAGGDSPLAAAHVDKRKRQVGRESDVTAGGGGVDVGKALLALPDIDCVPDADRSSIDELMRLYYRCLQGPDDDGEHEVKGAVAVVGTTTEGRGSTAAARPPRPRRRWRTTTTCSPMVSCSTAAARRCTKTTCSSAACWGSLTSWT